MSVIIWESAGIIWLDKSAHFQDFFLKFLEAPFNNSVRCNFGQPAIVCPDGLSSITKTVFIVVR